MKEGGKKTEMQPVQILMLKQVGFLSPIKICVSDAIKRLASDIHNLMQDVDSIIKEKNF